MKFIQKFIYFSFFVLYIYINCQEDNIIKENIIENNLSESNEEEKINIVEDKTENFQNDESNFQSEDEINENNMEDIINENNKENNNIEDIIKNEQNNIIENEIDSENILIKEENENLNINEEEIINIEKENLDNSHNYENIEQNNYNNKKEEKFEGLKILFEKYLLSFHYELLKYVPVPYDYLIMFVLGYFFMRIFTNGKSSIYVKNKRKLVDQNVAVIEKKLRDISKIQEKLRDKNNSDNKSQNPIQEIILPKVPIDLGKLDNIEKKLNELMIDLCERNKNDSKEKKLENNICGLQHKILEEIKNKDEDDDEEEEEEDDDKEEEDEREENEK